MFLAILVCQLLTYSLGALSHARTTRLEYFCQLDLGFCRQGLNITPKLHRYVIMQKIQLRWDEFEPNVGNAEELYRMIDGGEPIGFTETDFIVSESWKKLRQLAKAALMKWSLSPGRGPKRLIFLTTLKSCSLSKKSLVEPVKI